MTDNEKKLLYAVAELLMAWHNRYLAMWYEPQVEARCKAAEANLEKVYAECLEGDKHP